MSKMKYLEYKKYGNDVYGNRKSRIYKWWEKFREYLQNRQQNQTFFVRIKEYTHSF